MQVIEAARLASNKSVASWVGSTVLIFALVAPANAGETPSCEGMALSVQVAATSADDSSDGEKESAELTHGLSNGDDLSTIRLHRPLPEPLTSFGACVVDEYLYVFSGHNGVAHGFGADLLLDHFRRIKFDSPNAEWEELAMRDPAQSVALVTDGKEIYRIGGLSFRNRGDDPTTDFNSTTHFAKYDIASDSWHDLAPLPEPRSSLDAALVGRSIFVAGGWNLQGDSSREAPWHEDVLRFDLDDPASGWQSIKGPDYLVRAASVAAHQGELYLVGGIQERGITRRVSVLDPQTNMWREGPELPSDSSMAGFATSTFATGEKLYTTGASGVLYRLSEDGKEWEVANRLMYPRMFLRLLPVSEDRLIALGGTGMLGRTSAVESVDLSNHPRANLVRWSVDFGGAAVHSQSLVLDRGKLYAFGGNRSREAHDFSSGAFVDEAFVFDLSAQTVESLPKLPAALQSGAAFINSQTSEHRELVVMGGLGPSEEGLKYLSSNYSFDPVSKAWHESPSALPSPRAMFGGTVYDGAIWVFGGSGGRQTGLSQSVLHWWGDQTSVAPLHEIELPHPRRSFGGAELDGDYYLVGGLGDGMSIVEEVDVFNFDSRSWSTIPAPQVSRVFPSLASANGKLYLFGGFATNAGHFAPEDSLKVYDPQLRTWQTVLEGNEALPTSMSMFSFNDRLLFYGIDSKQDGLANFVVLDPEPMAHPETVVSTAFGGRTESDPSAEMAKVLIRRDANKDGKLSREELGKRLSSLIDEGDADEDEHVDLSELVEALKAREQAAEDEEATGDEDSDEN